MPQTIRHRRFNWNYGSSRRRRVCGRVYTSWEMCVKTLQFGAPGLISNRTSFEPGQALKALALGLAQSLNSFSTGLRQVTSEQLRNGTTE